MKMERVEQITGHVSYEVTDDRGRTIQLTVERAYELLDWLYDLRAELHQAATQNEIVVNPLDVFPAIDDLDDPKWLA